MLRIVPQDEAVELAPGSCRDRLGVTQLRRSAMGLRIAAAAVFCPRLNLQGRWSQKKWARATLMSRVSVVSNAFRSVFQPRFRPRTDGLRAYARSRP